MTRLLFVSLPLAGHLDWGGMLATAAHLVHRPSHQVAWASGTAVAPAVRQAGVQFVELSATGWLAHPPLPDEIPPERRAELRQERGLDSWLDPQAIDHAVTGLRTLYADWRPDVVVVEPYAAAATLAAEASGLPLVLCGRPAQPDAPPLPAHPASQRLRDLCTLVGLAGRYWDLGRAQIRSPYLHVDYFSQRWYADLPAIAPQTVFAGSVPSSTPAPDAPPVVLITLGSLFRDDPAFFRIAAEAVMLEGGQPLVVTGRRVANSHVDASPVALPGGCEVREWIDFDEVMPRVTGIIHHGGAGTTHAALRHGLPQVAVPHAGDQLAHAGRITQARVGYGVRPADFTLATARWLARQLLTNEDLHNQASVWRDDLARLGGAETAAHAIGAAFSPGNFMV